jgi:transposase
VLEVIIIGLDIAKHVFHAHGADERGRAVFSKRISRGKLLDFFAAQPSCTVALEACGGAHHWARQLIQLGHEVRLIPPAYVRPFVKRQKNDAIDAEAICEAAQRPSMRFVAVKSEQQQAAGLVFRTRDLLVRQRTQLINAIRGHLTEYGWIAPKGPSHVAMLADMIEEEEMASSLPEATHAMFRLMLDLLAGLNGKITDLDKEIARRAREDEVSCRLMTVPGIGRDRRSGTAGRNLCERPRLCRLAGSHASSKIDRRQAEAWCDIQNGRAHTQAPTHYWQQRRRAAGEQTRRAKGFVARTDAGSQTAHAGNGRARQQDGADRLGVTYKAGKLQSSGHRQGVSLADLRSSQV